MNITFNTIWEQYSRRMCFFIMHFIPRSHYEFDDIFQEIMLKIYNNIKNYDHSKSTRAWIYTIARNHCIDYLRSERSAVSLEEGLMADTASPEKVLMDKEMNETIQKKLESLSAEEQQICFLHFYEDFTYREISAVLGINTNTIKTKMRSIKKVLRHELRDESWN